MTIPDPDEILECPHRILGRTTWKFRELESTNSLALELGARLDARPDWHGLALLAGRQTRGRGQHGRAWDGPDGLGVWLSVLLDPNPACRRPAILTSWVAVSVARVVERFLGRPANLKWPNDVLVDGKKIAGILVEQRRGTVIGVGLNVRQSAEHFAEMGLPDATSLACLGAGDCRVPGVAEQLLDAMDQDWADIERGEGGGIERRWRDGLGLLGRPVRLAARGLAAWGMLDRLDWEGLSLRLETGRLMEFMPEEVSALAALDPINPMG